MKQKPQTIFRRAHEAEFVIVGNALARQRTLSHRARGILLWLLSYPPSWEIRLETLTTEWDGLAAVRTAIEELEDAGYIVRDQLRQTGGRFGAGLFVVHETPVPEDERSGAERRARRASKITDTDSPCTDLPDTVPPHAVKPHTVQPHAVNRMQERQTPTKTDSDKDISAAAATARAHAREGLVDSKTVMEQGASIAPSPALPGPVEPDTPSPYAAVFAAWHNAGALLTAQIADELKDAVGEFGEAFVIAGIEEMGKSGVRNLKYLKRILDACRSEKRMPGAPRPNTRPPAAQQAAKRAATEDPDNWAGKASNLPPPSPVRPFRLPEKREEAS